MIVLSYVASITLMLMELADKENNLYIMLMAQCTYTIWNNCMHTTFIFLSSGKIIVKKNPCIWILLAYCNTTTYIKSNRPRHNGVFIKFHNTWQIFLAWKGSIARLNHHFKLWFFPNQRGISSLLNIHIASSGII